MAYLAQSVPAQQELQSKLPAELEQGWQLIAGVVSTQVFTESTLAHTAAHVEQETPTGIIRRSQPMACDIPKGA